MAGVATETEGPCLTLCSYKTKAKQMQIMEGGGEDSKANVDIQQKTPLN